MPTAQLEGFEISYEVSGTGPAVLFTHGYQATGAMWEPQRAALDSRYRVITWDMRGHGRSGAPDDENLYSHDLLVADIAGLLHTLGEQSAVLVGHSLGGFASLRFYLDHPEMVRALVLFGTGPGYRDAEARGKWNEMAERFAASIEKRGLEALERADSREISTARHASPKGLAHAGRKMLAQFDSRVMDAITDVRVPTLVIVGTEDKPFLGSSEYMAKKIPGARLETIEGAGHAANMDKPDEFNAALLQFLDSL
jgi:pimeloyl-ACP methyl ester carboxylesterase